MENMENTSLLQLILHHNTPYISITYPLIVWLIGSCFEDGSICTWAGRHQERYTRDPEPFDWYQRWAGLKERDKKTDSAEVAIKFIKCRAFEWKNEP
jgi:hypothetical protein